MHAQHAFLFLFGGGFTTTACGKEDRGTLSRVLHTLVGLRRMARAEDERAFPNTLSDREEDALPATALRATLLGAVARIEARRCFALWFAARTR